MTEQFKPFPPTSEDFVRIFNSHDSCFDAETKKRCLIAVISCIEHKQKGYHDAIRNTWLKDINNHSGEHYVDYKFFNGGDMGAAKVCLSDEVNILASDWYEALCFKTREVCRWAEHYGYDYIHKTDTDTLINVPNLLASGFEKYDYMGGFNEDTISVLRPEPLQFASGGAGYWLSKKALTIVANHAITSVCGEDVFVADALKRNGILPTWHQSYKWRPGEQITKDMVSLHLSSALQKKYRPEMMYEQYENMKNLTRENRA